jgi:hypothetical protein
MENIKLNLISLVFANSSGILGQNSYVGRVELLKNLEPMTRDITCNLHIILYESIHDIIVMLCHPISSHPIISPCQASLPIITESLSALL